ncbi:MAG: hypothetical protein REI96_06175 [Flavobacterium nitrogenifigens]|uniref:hypothetical protein n=1 Tax=Flavobacterium nitrogenifigens TaxID=1617283 RepID=UPI00280A3729|nr:hypothetical protein [Flavobacterium nitrogenifigens]MDQ8012013.1 hypothetical protein [Flavobacterium nitrogenifigens]
MNDRTEINQRLADLYSVLYFCSEQQKAGRIYVFTIDERISINQERGSLLSQINRDNFPHEIRNYKISSALQVKVQITLNKLAQTNLWHYLKDPFTDENN